MQGGREEEFFFENADGLPSCSPCHKTSNKAFDIRRANQKLSFLGNSDTTQRLEHGGITLGVAFDKNLNRARSIFTSLVALPVAWYVSSYAPVVLLFHSLPGDCREILVPRSSCSGCT